MGGFGGRGGEGVTSRQGTGPFDLTGTVALVTGAGSPTGIGMASALLLAGQGADLVLAATTDRIHDRAAELGAATGRPALGLVADLTDPVAVERALGQVHDRHGRLDILVNNAGMATVTEPTQDDGALESIDPGRVADDHGPQPRHRLPGHPGRPPADGPGWPDRDGGQRDRAGDGDAPQPGVRRGEGGSGRA